MKKRNIITMVLVIALSFSAVAYAASISWLSKREDEDGNTIADSQGYYYDNFVDATKFLGVVSSADDIDYYDFETSMSAVGEFVLDLTDTNIDADIWLCDSNGDEIYPGYTVGTTKKLSGIFVPPNTEYFLKVEYKSGIPKRPYEVSISFTDTASVSMQQIRNIEDVPKSLLNNK